MSEEQEQAQEPKGANVCIKGGRVMSPEDAEAAKEREQQMAEAQQMLEEDAKARVQRVDKGLAALLERERCLLEVAITVTPQGNIPHFNIVPKRE